MNSSTSDTDFNNTGLSVKCLKHVPLFENVKEAVSRIAHFALPHCRVLPPGEFNGDIHDPMHIYSESFLTPL